MSARLMRLLAEPKCPRRGKHLRFRGAKKSCMTNRRAGVTRRNTVPGVVTPRTKRLLRFHHVPDRLRRMMSWTILSPHEEK